MFQTQIYKSWVEMQTNGGSSEVGLIGTYKVYLKNSAGTTLGTPSSFSVLSINENNKVFTVFSNTNTITFSGSFIARSILIAKDMPLSGIESNVCVYDFGRDVSAGTGFVLDLTDVIFYMVTIKDQG